MAYVLCRSIASHNLQLFPHVHIVFKFIYLRRFYLEELLRVKDTEVKASQKQQQQPQSGNIPKFK